MADQAKLAALQQYAETGSWEGAQQRLGGSKDAALARQSTLGGLVGAPAAATASTMPTVEAPYGRFASTISDYAGAYERSAANRQAMQSDYMSQVANAQSAHRAEADRAIAEAQAAHARRSGAGTADELSQWELEALATAQGAEYQDAAADESGRNADTAHKLEQGVLGANEAINRANAEEATEDERFRAAQQWDSEHPGVQVINNPEAMAEKDQWIDEWAGSDRLGGPRSQRQAALEASTAQRDAHAEDPFANPYGSDLSGLMSGQEQMLREYVGPEFTRQAFVDLNLRPDLGEEGQRLLARGMFEDLSPEEQMDAEMARREQAYFEEHGFPNPGEQRSWEEAERKNSGAADPNNRQVRRPDDPDVMRSVGVTPDDVARITTSDQWESALQTANNLLEGSDEPTYLPDGTVIPPQPPIMSAAQLRIALAEAYDDEQLEKLIVAMFAPSMVG